MQDSLLSPDRSPDDPALRQPALTRAHRWRVLGVGVLANASFMAVTNGLPATAVWMRSDYRLDNAGLGLLLGALGVGMALSELPWGVAADRWGDRRVLLCGLSISALILLVMAVCIAPGPRYVPALAAAAVGMGLAGIAGGSVNGASGRAIMRWFHEGERGLAMSIRQTAVPLGGGLGALLLPPLAVHAGFGWVYGSLAALCALSAALTWLWVHEPPDSQPDAPPHRPADAAPTPDGARLAQPVRSARSAQPVQSAQPARSVHCARSVRSARSARTTRITRTGGGLGLLRSVPVWRMASACGLLCMPQFAILSFASVFLHDAVHVGLGGIVLALGIVQAGAIVGRIWSGRHTDRRGNRLPWLRACTLWAAACFIPLVACCVFLPAIPQTVAPALVIAAVALAGVVISIWHGVAYAELASQAGAERAGTALGLSNSLVYVGYFLVPVVIPYLLGRSGNWTLVWSCASAVALLVWPLWHRGR